MMSQRQFFNGAFVDYRATKHCRVLGPRAEEIVPSARGDEYTYQVDRCCIVDRFLPSGHPQWRTRTGKRRVVQADDLNLRRANWRELWRLRDRFPAPSLVNLPAN